MKLWDVLQIGLIILWLPIILFIVLFLWIAAPKKGTIGWPGTA